MSMIGAVSVTASENSHTGTQLGHQKHGRVYSFIFEVQLKYVGALTCFT